MNFGFKGKGQARTGCKISTLTPFPLMISGKRFQLEETVFLLVIKSYVKKEWTYTCHILRNFRDLGPQKGEHHCKSNWNKGAPARVDRYLKKEYLCIV